MAEVRSYRDLLVWQRAMGLAVRPRLPQEPETHLILAKRVGVAPPGSTDTLLDKADEVGRMLNGLMSSLQKHAGRGPAT